MFMREEEKLARDVYLAMYNLWNLPVFQNIANSEQSHMDAMKKMIDFFGLEDPVIDQVGAFDNGELQDLFHKLTDPAIDQDGDGDSDLLDALYVGGLIEEKDMLDIYAALEAADNPLLEATYDELLRGSRNHLRAYVSAIESLGYEYEAQILSSEEIEEIIEEEVETGR